MTAGRRISELAPPGAKYFRLYYSRSDGSRIWLPENDDYYTVGSEPPDFPPGPFGILYWDAKMRRLDTRSAIPNAYSVRRNTLSGSHIIPMVSPKTAGFSGGAQGRPEALASKNHGPELRKEGADSSRQAKKSRLVPDDSTAMEDDIDQEQTQPATEQAQLLLMQMKTNQMEQRFIRDAAHTREVGETYLLSKYTRQELATVQQQSTPMAQQMSKSSAHQVRQMFELGDLYSKRTIQLFDLVHARLQALPSPGTDWPGIVNGALQGLERMGALYFAHQAEMARIRSGAPAHPVPPGSAKQEIPITPRLDSPATGKRVDPPEEDSAATASTELPNMSESDKKEFMTKFLEELQARIESQGAKMDIPLPTSADGSSTLK